MNEAAFAAKSWPFEQARALLKRVEGQSVVTFQTGFGPSGAPHVGTFGEVVRTNMVRRAFEELTEGKIKTRLIVFSDDYDGFRRVPDGMPESMNEDIGKPLSSVRDPFGEYPSFAARNNAALRQFLDGMEIDYEFISATEFYRESTFNNVKFDLLRNYDAIMRIMLPSLGTVRQETYSPFLPLVDGRLQQWPASEVYADAGQIAFDDPDGNHHVLNVLGLAAKLQWKVDWAARWMALNVDYEMHGKDLIDSAVLSTRICKACGRQPPLTYFYELFLDVDGSKFSKSKGTGMTMEMWNRYSATGPLAYFMFQSPRTAKIFAPSIVPRVTDDYLKALTTYDSLDEAARYDSPIWHVHGGYPLTLDTDVSYTLLLNLAEVSQAEDPETLMNYLSQYKSLTKFNRGYIYALIPGAIAYAREQMSSKSRRDPTDREKLAFAELADTLENLGDELDAEGYQYHVYEIGKSFMFEPLRDWFKAIYQVYFGAEQGPRLGSFIAAYGRARSIEFLRSVL